MGRKPRALAVTTDFGIPVEPTGIRVSADGAIEFLRGESVIVPRYAVAEASYERGKGPKVINRTPLDPTKLSANPAASFLKYSPIFAVDTNTRVIGEDLVSATAVVLCKTSTSGDQVNIRFAVVHGIEFRNIVSAPERIGWKVVIEHIVANPNFDPNGNMGIIVDSDLRSLSGINTRSAPIHNDYYLPPGIQLIYASADAGGEYPQNRILRHADKAASDLLAQIERSPERPDLLETRDEPFSHWAQWSPGRKP